VVLRPSGTEPVIRVMVEGQEEGLVRQLVKDLVTSVTAAAHA
jgi:phosphoglucosamine mutase